jgi:hypothetical protein
MTDAGFEYFRATVAAEHPSWSFDRVFQAALEASGHRGGFPRTAIPGSAEAKTEQAARRKAVEVRASETPEEQVEAVMAERRCTAVEVEGWLWASVWQ